MVPSMSASTGEVGLLRGYTPPTNHLGTIAIEHLGIIKLGPMVTTRRKVTTRHQNTTLIMVNLTGVIPTHIIGVTPRTPVEEQGGTTEGGGVVVQGRILPPLPPPLLSPYGRQPRPNYREPYEPPMCRHVSTHNRYSPIRDDDLGHSSYPFMTQDRDTYNKPPYN